MAFIKIGAGFVRLDRIAAILPDVPEHIGGVPVREAEPGRCRIYVDGAGPGYFDAPSSPDAMVRMVEAAELHDRKRIDIPGTVMDRGSRRRASGPTDTDAKGEVA